MGKRTYPPAVDRFWAKVQRTEGCWEWTGSKLRSGYGQFTVDGKLMYVHRFSYELHIGPIPDGLVIDHLCRNTSCVNPAHLEAVTDRTNILRGTAPAARNAARTHCVHGHEFTAENTQVDRDGHRKCKTCRRRIQSSRPDQPS